MKSLFLLLAFLPGICTAAAQTKEETQKFIEKCMNEAIGLKTYSTLDGSRVEEALLESNSFGQDMVQTVEKRKDYSRGTFTQYNKYQNLNWANVTTVVLDTVPSLYHDDNVATITLSFSTKIKHVEFCEGGTYQVSCDNTYYWDGFTLIIPRNRAESCRKALLHWVQLHRQEDNDPFKD